MVSIILYIVYFLIFIVSILYLYFKYKFSYWNVKGVSYLEPKFPLGNIEIRKHFVHMLIDAYNLPRNNQHFVGAFMFSNPIAIPTNLDLIKNILKHDFGYFYDRGFYYNEHDDPFSVNLLTLEGEKWKKLRAKFTPIFTSGKMKFMFPTIVKVGNELSTTLSKLIGYKHIKETVKNNKDVEMKELMSRFTTDVIGACVLGIECNSLNNPKSMFLEMGNRALYESFFTKLKRFFLVQSIELGRKLHARWWSKDVTDFFMEVVRDAIEYREKHQIHRNDFMDVLIELKNNNTENLSFKEVAAQAFSFFLAGYETSATTISYCIYELALNESIQEKARDQINEVLKHHNEILTYEAMMKMTYLDQIISEALRKYPPIAAVFRLATKDYSVPDTDKIIEKGTYVMIPAYAIQHDPEIYPNPEEFDPSRFTPEHIKERHSSTFLGFGDGYRNCIGARFGLLQIRIGLVSLLKEFKFSKCSKTVIPIKFDWKHPVLVSDSGIWVNVKHL